MDDVARVVEESGRVGELTARVQIPMAEGAVIAVFVACATTMIALVLLVPEVLDIDVGLIGERQLVLVTTVCDRPRHVHHVLGQEEEPRVFLLVGTVVRRVRLVVVSILLVIVITIVIVIRAL